MTVLSRVIGAVARLPRPTTRDVIVETHIPIPMADGATLFADRYYPNVAGGDRLPLLLNRNPYGAKFEGLLGRVFAERGYQVLVVRCRGTFGSEGEWNPFFAEQADGHATLDWIAKQPWFNGSLGMFGGSYHGLTQWAVAESPPPFLKAIAPGVTASNFSAFIYPGGSFALDSILTWTYGLDHGDESLLRGLLGQRKTDKLLRAAATTIPLSDADDALVGHRSDFFQDWLENEDPRGPYWTPIDFSARRDEVPPAAFIAGWYDIFAPEQVRDFEAVRAAGRPARLTVGPWHHGTPGGALAMTRDTLRWMDTYVGDDSRSAPDDKPVRLFVMGARRWQDFDDWPVPATSQQWYLQPDSGLGQTAPPESSPDAYRYDPADPTPVLGGASLFGRHAGAKDNRPTEARHDVLTYTTTPFADDVTVIGNVRANLHVRSSADYTDFFLRVCDVAPDGTSTNLCDGIVRLTPTAIERNADGSFQVAIVLGPTANTFRAGHAMRLQVSSGAHPLYARNPGSGEPLGKATTLIAADQEVLHDPHHASVLEIPVLATPVARQAQLASAVTDEHWQQFEQRWTGLLTYRYLGKRTPVLDIGVERETMPLRHDMRNATGGVMAAPLCIAAPEPYWLDDVVVPAPVLMSYEIVDPAHDVGEVEVLREVTHIGRTMGFSRARIVDASDHARLIAVSTGVGVSLGKQPDDFAAVENEPIAVEDSPDLPPLHQVFGARCEDGVWRLPPVTADVAAPHGALHLGPINIVLEAAATHALDDDARQVESWTITMLRPGTVGPFRAEAEVLSRTARAAVQLTLRDEGRDDRIIATALAMYR